MKIKTKFENRFWMQFKKLTAIEAGVILAFLSVQTHAAPGDVDLSFDPGSTLDGAVIAVGVQPDGRIIIAGDFHTTHDAVCPRIARLNADGSADRSFLAQIERQNGDAYVGDTALQTDGRIVIAGWFDHVSGVGRTNLARLHADGSLDATFLKDMEGVAGWVDLLALQADGKVLIQGSFNAVNGIARTNFARLNGDGSLDETFNVVLENYIDVAGPEPGSLAGIAVQADGKILIGGGFTSVNGVAQTNIARLNPDGSLDQTFSVQLGWHRENDEAGYATSFAVQPDGKIIVGGGFTTVNGLGRTNLARLHPEGSVDPSFDCPLGVADDETYQVRLRSDGKIVAIGGFTLDGMEWLVPVLLETNGAPVSTFQNPGLAGRASQLALHTGGKPLLVMDEHLINHPVRSSLVRLNDDGTLDSAFDTGKPIGPNGGINCLALEGDGRILIGGQYLSAVNGQARGGVARLKADGSLDDNFAPSVRSSDPAYPASSGMMCLAVQPDGKFLLGGYFDSVNGEPRGGVARIQIDGALDRTFLEGLSGVGGGQNGPTGVYGLAIQANSQILIGGNFSVVNGQPRVGLARLNPDGSLDVGFDAHFGSVVSALAIQPDGKILVASPTSLARLNPDGFTDGVLWSSDIIWCVGVQPDGKIVVGGSFDSLGGQPWRALARVNADLTVDDSFLGAVTGDYVEVRRLALDADGKIVVAGQFNAVSGAARTNFARLHPDGSLDASFVTSFGAGTVVAPALVVQPDTRILLGELFTVVNQTARGYVARLMGSLVSPTIVRPPQSVTAEVGGSAWVSVQGAGHPAVTYQWFFNGTNLLVGATNDLLEVQAVQASQAGRYTVVIWNAGGAVTSSPIALSVIAPVERRMVPGVVLGANTGSTVNLEYADSLGTSTIWQPLAAPTVTSPPQFYFDVTTPLPSQRFYRAWQDGPPSVMLSLDLHMIPALTLTGDVSSQVRVDGINQFGPTDAWFTLATVTLTNTTQFYFDVSALGQPQRLYRLVPVP